MNILKVNGVAIKNPSKMEYQIYDLDSEEGSGRSQSGLMFRDRVAVKRKLVCEFPPMTLQEMHTFLNAIDPQFFTLTFPDPKAGSLNATMTAYAGDRTAPVYMYDEDRQTWLFEKMSVNFIER